MTFPLFFFGKCDKFHGEGSLPPKCQQKRSLLSHQKRGSPPPPSCNAKHPPPSFSSALWLLSLSHSLTLRLCLLCFFKTPPHPCVRDHSMQAPFSPSSKTLVCPIVNREVKTLKKTKERREMSPVGFLHVTPLQPLSSSHKKKRIDSLSILIPLLPLSKDSFRNCAFC